MISTEAKVKTLDEIRLLLEQEREHGKRVVQCHGVFDLLHPGHIRHFREAKSRGDILVVSVTPDRYVNKGPGRPVFTESLRLESIASLQEVDYVTLNNAPDALPAIQAIRPHLYVKGGEYANHETDVTGKISLEAETVSAFGGQVHYTHDIVFSSSSLLNRFFDPISPEITQFLKKIRALYSLEQLLEMLDSLWELRVLVIGDAIIDEYQYTDMLGKTGKGVHMVARCLEKEAFLGGSLIIANHVAQFAGRVSLLTAVGGDCPYGSFIKTSLDPKIKPLITVVEDTSTLVKKRYVIRDGNVLTKLFETYAGCNTPLSPAQTDRIVDSIQKTAADYDLILVADFGNGFTNAQIVDALSDVPSFLALNAQLNSGNRGYHVVTQYRRADFVSLNEAELRLAMHNPTSQLEGMIYDLSQIMNASSIGLTRGVKGVFCYSNTGDVIEIPAIATQSIDRVGAGDAFLSVASLALAKKLPLIVAGFFGSLAAAMSVQLIGNQEAIKKQALQKFLIRLMK